MFEHYSRKGKSPNLPNLTFIFYNIFFRNKKSVKKIIGQLKNVFFEKYSVLRVTVSLIFIQHCNINKNIIQIMD